MVLKFEVLYIVKHLNLSSAELNNLIFYPLGGVSLYRDPQLQVGENYSYLFNLRPNVS